MKPKHGFSLNIQKEKITYGLGANRCWIDSFVVTDKTIFCKGGICTEIGGDERMDSLSKYIEYCGDYVLTDSLLTINNTMAIINLKKN